MPMNVDRMRSPGGIIILLVMVTCLVLGLMVVYGSVTIGTLVLLALIFVLALAHFV